MVDDRLSYRGLSLWKTRPAGVHGRGDPDNGRPGPGRPRVHAAGAAGQGLRGRPDLRGKPEAALDAGADRVLLFTDLANPTSNALYQRLGYQPVEDRAIWSFPPLTGRRHRRVTNGRGRTVLVACL